MIDLVVGPQAYHRLPEMVAEVAARRAPGRHRHAGDRQVRRASRRAAASGPTAFLTVQEGCDKFCTYCVVPYTRGAEISRPFADVVTEAQALVDGGAREITLLGQNVNACREAGSTTLIRAIAADRWARADPLHHQPPRRHERRADRRAWRGRQADALSPFAGAVGQRPHPQGDEPQPQRRILSAHDRARSAPRGPTSPFRATSSSASPARPKKISTDTLAIVDAVGYASAYSFKYSRPAGNARRRAWKERLRPNVMDERLQRLQRRLAEHSLAFNHATIGKDLTILIDRKGRLPGQMIGKSPWLQSVFVETDAVIGDMVDVTVTHALPNSLGGVLRHGRWPPDGQARPHPRPRSARRGPRPARAGVRAALSARARCSAITTAIW